MDPTFLKRYLANTMPGKAAMAMSGLAKNAMDSGPMPDALQMPSAKQESIIPEQDPFTAVIGGGLGGMAAKGLVGSVGADAIDTSGAMLARKAALNRMGAGSIANSEARAPIAQLGDDVTRTIASGDLAPISTEEAAVGSVKASPNLSDLSGKGVEFNTDQYGNTFNRFENGNLPGSTGGSSQQLKDLPWTGENGDAIMQGIRDKISQANQATEQEPQFGKLKLLMGGR